MNDPLMSTVIKSDPPRLDSHQIISRLGQGGMSDVYLALDTRLERKVAVKVLKTAAVNDGQHQRVLNEARLLAKINHPNIVQIYDITDVDGQIALVMEYVQGKTLAQYQAEKVLSLRDKLALIEQISIGLAVAHKQNVLHCDLKPDNVMIDAQGQVKIMDFGIGLDTVATQQAGQTEQQNQYRRFVSARASSPEQLNDETVDFRSDLFALGLLVFNLLSSQHPFGQGSASQVAQRIVKQKAKDARQIIPALPIELCALLNQLLQKSPSKRPQSSHEVAHQFKQVLVMLCDQQNLAQQTLPLDIIDTKAVSPMKPKTAIVAIALTCMTILSVWFFTVYQQPTPSRHVVVLPPTLSETSTVSPQQLQLVKTTVADAVRQVVVNGKDLNLIALHSLSDSHYSMAQIAQASGATDIVTTQLDCQQNRCNVLISRLSGENWAVQAQKNWPTALANYRDIYTAGRSQALTLFAEHGSVHLQPRAVDEADYLQYIEVYLDVVNHGANTPANLQRLAQLLSRSEHFYALYSLYREVSIGLYQDSRDERYLQQLKQVLRLAPIEYKDSVFHTIDRIFLALKSKDLPEAHHLLDVAEQRGADMAQIHELRGNWFESNDQFDKAIEHYQKALAIRPSQIYLSALASFYQQIGDLAQASEYLTQILAYAPDDYFANALLGDIALQQGNTDLAIKRYTNIIAVQPTAYDHYHLSLAYTFDGQFDLAFEHARQAAAGNDNNAMFQLNLADSYQLNGQMPLAHDGYRQVLQLEQNTDSFDAWVNKAQAYAQLGQVAPSLKALNKLLKLADDRAEYPATAVLVYTMAEEYQSALVHLEEAIDNDYGTIWFNFPWYQPLCQYPQFSTLMVGLKDISICSNRH